MLQLPVPIREVCPKCIAMNIIPGFIQIKVLKMIFGGKKEKKKKRNKNFTKVSMLGSSLTSLFTGYELLCNC